MLLRHESAIYHLTYDRQDIIRSEAYSALREAKPPREWNLAKKKKKQKKQEALRELKCDESIVVVKADKGNCTVVMNREDCKNQVCEMLQDKKTYQSFTDKRRNPTSKVEQDLKKKLLDLKNQGNLTEAEYWKLTPLDPSMAYNGSIRYSYSGGKPFHPPRRR